MGKAKSYEIIEYKKDIMTRICGDDTILKLMGCTLPSEMPYKKVFPYKYVPDVITKYDKFINIDDRTVLDYTNNVYTDITIYIFIMCHKEVVEYIENNKKCIWYDELTCALDDLFSDKYIGTSVKKMYLYATEPYYQGNEFIGRVLTFKTKDFTNGKKYGK